MKRTWLHKFFGLFFIPPNGRAKSAKQLISTVLPFHPYKSWHFWATYLPLLVNVVCERPLTWYHTCANVPFVIGFVTTPFEWKGNKRWCFCPSWLGWLFIELGSIMSKYGCGKNLTPFIMCRKLRDEFRLITKVMTLVKFHVLFPFQYRGFPTSTVGVFLLH